MNFEIALKEKLDIVNGWISELSPKGEGYHKTIFDAANYSIENGGKRIRPVLTLAVCQMLGGNIENAKHFACALEFIHTYSLIHDDLPCMDNDDYRRGKLTNHKVFGEAMAVLAGDTLLTHAFYVASQSTCPKAIVAIAEIAKGAGADGMIGGQVIDMEVAKTKEQLFELHKKKTGALISLGAYLGSLAANATKEEQDAVISYAQNLGLAFQIKDDILDVTGDETLLGKPVGSDEKSEKQTFVTFYGLDGAKEQLEIYTQSAKDALKPFGEKAEFLLDLADYLLNRNY